MSDPSIAAMIREVLAEELKKLGGVKVLRPPADEDDARTEEVSIASNGDLASFVKKLLGYAGNNKTRKDIESGRLTFQLAGSAAPASPSNQAASASPAASGGIASVASGFFSERQVDRLPRGTVTLRLGTAVKLTPLARDRLRNRGIKIERTEQ